MLTLASIQPVRALDRWRHFADRESNGMSSRLHKMWSGRDRGEKARRADLATRWIFSLHVWQKVRNMKSKTAAKFNEKRLEEKRLKSTKKQSRRRDFD